MTRSDSKDWVAAASPLPVPHLGGLEEEGEEGEEGEPGKAKRLCWSWCSSESTRSGMPGEVPTVSRDTSSGSRT